MKNAFLLFCLFCIAFSGRSFAQISAPETGAVPDLYRNSIYLEIGGNGGLLTLNYERLIPLAAPHKMLALRVGGLFVPSGSRQTGYDYEFYLPLEVSVLMGKRAVKLELGLGTTIFGNGGSYLNNGQQLESYHRLEALSVLRVGGRWQKPGKNWFVRVGFTPVLQENYTVIPYPFSPWAGISVGYNF